jgi:superfamily II DNA or RNA helicase
MRFEVGALVRARGREWVVLPESEGDLLVLRPLGGGDDERAGIYQPIESVETATFPLPDPDRIGDHRSCRLLRDAVRLGFRSSAGPFRSFGRIAVDPRPYQLVPLLMGLRLDPVRLLIADDVGIGKTIETCLIARELLDRAEVRRLAVLCPPQLAEQWQRELAAKFHIEAELVLPSTISRLERGRRMDESIFDRYPFVIVSTDFIKADRRRDEFLQTCPELVIVDEAHTCVAAQDGRTARHQRAQLLRGLAARADQHLILVTATPHSGKDDDFRALLSLLDGEFGQLPEDLGGEANRRLRERLARHFVQRRREHIRHYLGTDTTFPERAEPREVGYSLGTEYKRFFERVLNYARETVSDESDGRHRQRIRWWSVLALLRSLASSPAAAAATLRERAGVADTPTAEEADDAGTRAVLDLEDQDGVEQGDVAPGSQLGEHARDADAHRRRMLEMARQAEQVAGSEQDVKLCDVTTEVRRLVSEGYAPIVFCRFIPTAQYVAEYLRQSLNGVAVEAVTGLLPPDEREERVATLGDKPKRVLVCTDCLSEGVNLQDHFNAVIHYDLAWNPTRHEQREGRVDRYGQKRRQVQMVMVYGRDNRIDGIVLDVLIRKHQRIKSALGISVPVPINTNQVMEAIFEGLLLRRRDDPQMVIAEVLAPTQLALHQRWDTGAATEERHRTIFAQETIKVDDVARELEAVRAAVGFGVDVRNFVREALRAHGAGVQDHGILEVDLGSVREELRRVLPLVETAGDIRLGFEPDVPEDTLWVTRTHPFVDSLAGYVMQSTLDPLLNGVATRAGTMRTGRVRTRTTLLLVRFRYHIVRPGSDGAPLLAEDCQLLAFEGAPTEAKWLPPDAAEALLDAAPDGNVGDQQARMFVKQVIEGFHPINSHLATIASERAQELLDAHRRVRQSARERVRGLRVEPVLPSDVLGVYVFVPVPGA